LIELGALPTAAGPGSVLADSDVGKGSPIGLLVVLLLIVAVYFLYRSMNRHLRKVPPQFGRPPEQSPEQQSDRPAEPRPTEPPADQPRPAEPPADQPRPAEPPADQPYGRRPDEDGTGA